MSGGGNQLKCMLTKERQFGGVGFDLDLTEVIVGQSKHCNVDIYKFISLKG